jgi:hypothetical protein
MAEELDYTKEFIPELDRKTEGSVEFLFGCDSSTGEIRI